MSDLRLLTYNVRSLRDDADAVSEVIRACSADVVAVQEAPRFLRWRSKRAAMARKAGLVVASAHRPGGLTVLTSLRARVLDTSFALLPKTPKLHQRAVCSVLVDVAGERWAVSSVHLSLSDDERWQHLEPLWAAVRRWDAPIVVAGDINERPRGRVWQALAAELQDAYAVAPDGPEETFSMRRPHKRIDGIFVDPSVQVLGCHAVHGGGPEGLDWPTLVAATDHLPVLAVLRR
ncbi:MAG TPA: endonuclease/exonuclease/phosphatase family protein [Mycobacteriales bacterium]|nr:endonuclease/exonuclease/phosphatase family protein [Mycobacteriales bacterium]